jgi:CRP/FNR family transcriptional regulator, cyclic AMP receptor protein
MHKQEPTLWLSQADPHKLLAQVRNGRTTTDYRKDQAIFEQGQVADTVFFIQQGRVKISVTSEHGKEAVVAILDEGQFFGEGCLEDGTARPSSAHATTDCRITSITKTEMLAAVHDQPKFSRLFMHHLLNRNSRIEADIVDQLFNSSEKRLARLLLLLANYGKEGNPPIVPVTISQETLATMIGTTRSRVCHFMNKFRNAGYIDYNGTIEVHQSLLNSVLHDVPTVRDNDELPE